MAVRPSIDFWFDFASTYSYLSAMRIDALAMDAGVDIRWRPFLLGPIFGAQGWNTSPFNIYPAKGRYMWRDMERICQARGLALAQPPDPFPQNSLLAARVAQAIRNSAAASLGDYCKHVFRAEFAEARNISEEKRIADCVIACGLEPKLVLDAAVSQPMKDGLRAETEAAQALGIFGAPTFVTPDGELFWGDDRLETTLEWSKATS